MVVENCPAHLQITGLNAIKLIFATKYYKQNTTHGSGRFSELKSSLKAHEKQADSTYISVLDALRPFSKSWASVTEKTIVFATQTLTTLQSSVVAVKKKWKTQMTTFHLLPCDCESHLKIPPSVDQGVMTSDAYTFNVRRKKSRERRQWKGRSTRSNATSQTIDWADAGRHRPDENLVRDDREHRWSTLRIPESRKTRSSGGLLKIVQEDTKLHVYIFFDRGLCFGQGNPVTVKMKCEMCSWTVSTT